MFQKLIGNTQTEKMRPHKTAVFPYYSADFEYGKNCPTFMENEGT